MRWTAPPTRREVSLALFSLIVFALSYNIDSTVRIVGLSRENAVLSRLGFGGNSALGPDGIRISGAQDALERAIYGEWAWQEGEVAGDAAGSGQAKGVGRFGAMWLGKRDIGEVRSRTLGQLTVDQAIWRWGDDVPRGKVVKHVPGYTTVDNIILFNGTMNIVTEDPESVPPLSHIVLSTDLNKWNVLTPDQARRKFGSYGGRISGISWMGADSSPHNSTLIALWRAYSMLDPDIGPDGVTKLSPPRRLIYPYYGFFTDPNPVHADVTTRRQRVVNGIHPELVKAAFPHLTVMYYGDWEDYHKLGAPFVFDRLVVADRTAATHGVRDDEAIYAAAFKAQGPSDHWWEPVRRTLATYFEVYGAQAPKKVVTYVSRQSHADGLRLSPSDHNEFVAALMDLERDDIEVHVVSDVDGETSWGDRLRAITRSTVVVGVHDNGLVDCAFMQRNPQATLMELFPPQTFARDQEIIARSLNIQYMAWWNDERFTSDNLPVVSPPHDHHTVPIDIPAMIKSIRQTLH